jgi:hypothetical protein
VASELSEQTAECCRIVVQVSESAVEMQLAILIGGPGEDEPLAAEDTAEYTDSEASAPARHEIRHTCQSRALPRRFGMIAPYEKH